MIEVTRFWKFFLKLNTSAVACLIAGAKATTDAVASPIPAAVAGADEMKSSSAAPNLPVGPRACSTELPKELTAAATFPKPGPKLLTPWSA